MSCPLAPSLSSFYLSLSHCLSSPVPLVSKSKKAKHKHNQHNEDKDDGYKVTKDAASSATAKHQPIIDVDSSDGSSDEDVAYKSEDAATKHSHDDDDDDDLSRKETSNVFPSGVLKDLDKEEEDGMMPPAADDDIGSDFIEDDEEYNDDDDEIMVSSFISYIDKSFIYNLFVIQHPLIFILDPHKHIRRTTTGPLPMRIQMTIQMTMMMLSLLMMMTMIGRCRQLPQMLTLMIGVNL